jgi:hypothetical protein
MEPHVVQGLTLGGDSQMVLSAIIISWRTPLVIIDRKWMMYNTVMLSWLRDLPSLFNKTMSDHIHVLWWIFWHSRIFMHYHVLSLSRFLTNWACLERRLQNLPNQLAKFEETSPVLVSIWNDIPQTSFNILLGSEWGEVVTNASLQMVDTLNIILTFAGQRWWLCKSIMIKFIEMSFLLDMIFLYTRTFSKIWRTTTNCSCSKREWSDFCST